MSDPRTIEGMLVELARGWGLEHPLESARLVRSWETIVGPKLAEHCRPAGLRDGVLKIEVDSPAWAAELRYLGRDVVRAVNERVGREIVREVRTVVAAPRDGPKRGDGRRRRG
ncbi:MAG: DUF721 domain-containing protein [Actinomycetota bacterium]